jgi:membrane-bound lytic murein transglycosylase B
LPSIAGDPDGVALARPSDAPALAGWYRLAAAEYGVSDQLLRALHQVESNAAPDGCVANLEASGAVGPFQFKPATFRQFGVDGNLDGDRDICSFADALFTAARYLRALGAEDVDSPATREALVRYGTDSDRVLSLARHYREVAAIRP